MWLKILKLLKVSELVGEKLNLEFPGVLLIVLYVTGNLNDLRKWSFNLWTGSNLLCDLGYGES